MPEPFPFEVPNETGETESLRHGPCNHNMTFLGTDLQKRSAGRVATLSLLACIPCDQVMTFDLDTPTGIKLVSTFPYSTSFKPRPRGSHS